MRPDSGEVARWFRSRGMKTNRLPLGAITPWRKRSIKVYNRTVAGVFRGLGRSKPLRRRAPASTGRQPVRISNERAIAPGKDQAG